MRTCFAAFFALASGLGVSFAEDTSAEKIVFDFVGKYCLECHDSISEKGERDFEAFELPLENVQDLIAAKEIIDQVTLKEMPPKDADQPTDEERLAVLKALRGGVVAARDKMESTGARTVMRRLSNREYENTLEVLFDRRVDTLGLTANFPKENTANHIDTIGKSLITSGFLVDQYFQAANRLVELRLGKPEMEPKEWHFKDHFVQYEELSGPHRAAFDYKFLCIYEQPDTDTRQGSFGHIEDFLEGVPVSGFYEVKALANAMHRDTHYDVPSFGIDFTEPFILGVVTGDVTKGHIHYPQAIQPILAQTTLADNKFEWKTFKVWLEAGQTPRFIFPNGPIESRASVLEINKKYKDEFGKEVNKGVSRTHLLRDGKLPHIRIDEIKIRGPLKEEGGTKEERAVFGEKGFQSDKAVKQLYTFAERAFRRPLNDADKARIKKMYDSRIADKAKPRDAALDTIKLILCSPSFLYLAEVTDEKQTQLGPYDLASRLSYALWASPPDNALLSAAKSGSILDPKEIREQAKRMLEDKRVDGFVEGFLDSWLNLRDLGGMPPPRERNKSYYAENLPASMKEEARLLFKHIFRTNAPVSDFLDANYTFIDKKLAKHYNLPEKDKLRLADGFQKVSIEKNHQRGGILGTAAVLTVIANGVETSPVTRGVWVSENILGISPPLPPDEVPDIDADTRGATTIREKLAKHSADKTCSECHRKFDFLGFGLENFDPVGHWRGSYPQPKGPEPPPHIDTSGEFSSGEKFKDFQGLKDILLASRKDLFTRHLIEQILSYSTGRLMEPVDQYVIDDIFEKVKADNYGFRTLIVESMASEIFRNR